MDLKGLSKAGDNLLNVNVHKYHQFTNHHQTIANQIVSVINQPSPISRVDINLKNQQQKPSWRVT